MPSVADPQLPEDARTQDHPILEHLPHFIAARQHYLDALPIAAAVIRSGVAGRSIECSNTVFKHFEKPLQPRARKPLLILDRNGLGARVDAFLQGAAPDAEFQWRDGDEIGGRHFTVRLARLMDRDGQGPRCMMSLIDRTAEMLTQQSLRREMLSDSLTGLRNRAGFTEMVEQMAGEDERNFAVLIVDLVRFSRINEYIGPMAGDELIITVARRLTQALRAGDGLARLGGDEFGMLIRLHDGKDDAVQVAQRIQSVLGAPFRLSELEISVECSIGCAVMEDTGDVEKLVRSAQFALKRAKETGEIEVYQPTTFNMARRRFSLETALRRAVDNGELHLAFQPLVDLATDRVSGFEALARWEHPEQGEITPADFIPVAEESGLIVPLGRWALGEAARTLAAWDVRANAPVPVKMSVNLSAIQLSRDDIAQVVGQELGRAGIEGRRFTLELTESAVIADPERAVAVLDSLKELNTTLAMDDFGTGYSSLAYLQRLPIDILKIDRSFITGMLEDRNKVAIVRAVLSLADALGMKTTAEGIETVELSRTLAALGCAMGQGFYYSCPLDADAAYAYWRASNS
ncbi:bifunctional diguanylate cyclase/phosphodiesterase [Sphingomonas sp. C3-2]|uniref:putative bifunctional diguanylate cyclase/phosphodiesterase n=1 Tax=Sphingomonas sp. C3-2 TaxID=3062169 RepID=UPI00294B0343|nr:bifunctional diguanylate cyclase/phosphodiesterase [Sphingomonas sp. C3-2]WOK36025.1 bifunctional diguanylate cyclase/phosphodiesterase [Sphingomonas sp. C3-2]